MKRSKFGFFEYLSMVLREHAESLVLAVVLALLVRVFVFSAFLIRSEAMAPTLRAGELVFGFRAPFGLQWPGYGHLTSGRSPRPGELVVFKSPQGDLALARVVGLPGDRLEMKNQHLVINGQVCQYESFRPESLDLVEKCPPFSGQVHLDADWPVESWGPVVVQPGEIFVLNDNRRDNHDSRTWGGMPLDVVQASAILIGLSLNWGASNEESWIRWERTFSRLN